MRAFCYEIRKGSQLFILYSSDALEMQCSLVLDFDFIHFFLHLLIHKSRTSLIISLALSRIPYDSFICVFAWIDNNLIHLRIIGIWRKLENDRNNKINGKTINYYSLPDTAIEARMTAMERHVYIQYIYLLEMYVRTIQVCIRSLVLISISQLFSRYQDTKRWQESKMLSTCFHKNEK